jgi:hypothetical protein
MSQVSDPPRPALMQARYRLYTYEEAGQRLGYVRWLTRTGKLGYIVKTWRRGWLLRGKRFIPELELSNSKDSKMDRRTGVARCVLGDVTPPTQASEVDEQ